MFVCSTDALAKESGTHQLAQDIVFMDGNGPPETMVLYDDPKQPSLMGEAR
jgi:hypothetical protein